MGSGWAHHYCYNYVITKVRWKLFSIVIRPHQMITHMLRAMKDLSGVPITPCFC